MGKNIFQTFLIMNQADIKNNTGNVGLVPHCIGGQMTTKGAYLKMGVPRDIFQRVTISEDMVAGLLVYNKEEFHKIHDAEDIPEVQKINNAIYFGKTIPGFSTGDISDGYHTFDELYEHRIVNFMAVCSLVSKHTNLLVWRSEKHSDGSKYDGWFILGIGLVKGEQITYHLPMSKWKACAKIVNATMECAPEWDGHTSADVLERLSKL